MSKKEKRLRLIDGTQLCLSDIAMQALRKAALLFSKELTEELTEIWAAFLNHFSNSEIDYAFEKWLQNGEFFPRPSDIQKLALAFRESKRIGMPKYPQHGEGYDENDIKILCRMYRTKYPQPIGHELSQADRDALLDELDQVTGRAF